MKTTYSRQDIQNFLCKKYHEKINILPLKEGQESQTYWYLYGQQAFVLRINSCLDGFQKDLYAFSHFHSSQIPIPPIVQLGKYDDKNFYCISKKVDGKTYEDSSREVIENLLPQITDLLLAISDTDISHTEGYGTFDSSTGNAPFSSWKQYLSYFPNSKNWETIKGKEFVDADLIDAVKKNFFNLIPFCPENRQLIHGDFGSNNLLTADGRTFSAVIDWDCAAYGDFLYDVATSFFWSPWLLCMERTSAYWEKTFQHLPEFYQRIQCYQLHIGLRELWENIEENDIETTLWLQNRCRQLLDEL